MPTLSFILQLLGMALTLFGLGETWWKWAPDDHRVKLLLRRRRAGSVHGVASLRSTFWATADGDVKRTSILHGLEGKVDVLEQELADVKKEMRERATRSEGELRRLEEGQREHRAVIDAALAEHRRYMDRRTAEGAVDGIGIAALGVALTMVGMVASAL